MNQTGGVRTRVLVADADEARRKRLREDLGGDFAVAETASAEETLLWLEDQAPGLTLMDHRLPGAGGAALVARIRELHPEELVVILTPNLSASMCRAAMRAGAYDCLERGERLAEEIRPTCEAAAARLCEAERGRRANEDHVRTAVRRHEREAAGRLAGAENLAAWGAVDVGVRRHLLREYARAAEAAPLDADRERILSDLAGEAATLARPGDVLTALHVHAAATRGTASDEALDRARECLVRALARVADLRAPSPSSTPAGRTAAEAVGGRAWHRWRVAERGEEWCLVVDGRPAARLSCGPDGARGWIASGPLASHLEAVALPPVPEALREVERRLGMPLVVNVRSASAKT